LTESKLTTHAMDTGLPTLTVTPGCRNLRHTAW